jgi:hypothetical protein
MSLRLLSFLSLIQERLERAAAADGGHAAIRSVNYEQGLGRLLFRSGGAITLQVQGGVSGAGCIKATLTWPGLGVSESRSFFPGLSGHDWAAAAESLAQAWIAGPDPEEGSAPRDATKAFGRRPESSRSAEESPRAAAAVAV